MTHRRSVALFALVLVIYAALAVRTAAASPLNYDEQYTFKLARFGSLSELWGWLRSGTDLNPPANYVATRVSHELVGPTVLGTRLPSVLAYGAAVLMTFTYLRLSLRSELAAWVGGLTLLACTLPYYAVVARAYAPMVMWGAAVLLLRHLARESTTPRPRALAGVGLGVSVAASMYTHYYGVFVLLPIALAEGVGRWRTGRFSWTVLIPTAVGAATWLGLLPLVRTAREFASGFWGRASWQALELVYGNMLLNFAVPLVTVSTVCYLARRGPEQLEEAESGAAADAGAVVGFLLIPVVGVATAVLTSGAFDKRYVVLGYLGAAALFAGLVAPRLRGRPFASAAVLLVLAGWWLLGTELRYRKQVAEGAAVRSEVAAARGLIEVAPAVVITDPQFYLLVASAGPAEPRLSYTADPVQSRRLLGQDTDDRNLLQLARADTALNVRPFAEVAPVVGTAIVGEGWQKAVWERAGYVFEPLPTNNPKVRAVRVVKVPGG